MSTDDDHETTHVIIIGAGPTGALLSALLTQFEVPHVVLEKEEAIVTDPRGIALDEDGIRILQGLGLYDKIFSTIGQSIGYAFFISGKEGLDTRPFLKVNFDTSEGITGHVGAICHQQPVMEQCIRSVAGGVDGTSVRLGAQALEIQEDQSDVEAKYSDANGTVRWVKGKFLVGADGKTGFTRKKYLEPRGIFMESKPGYEYKETWVAVNYGISLPTPDTHPNFPLWKVGYSPDQVYEAFFPRNFRFIGNPDRPAVCGTFGRRQDRLWRFEFVVQNGEDGNEMATFENASSVIFPYLTHEGTKYGLTGRIQFPPDCINVLRSRPFTFAARSCNKWALNRVILCGDAAHVMPPFGGQGIASGFRDASGLAWRLAYTYRIAPEVRHSALFDGWFAERKQQLDRSIASTVKNGDFCTTRNAVKIFFRNWMLWLMQQIPSCNRWLERGPRNEGAVRYIWSNNMVFLPEFAGGIAFPQVYCQPLQLSSTKDEPSVLFTDDAIFKSNKKSLFQLVVLVDSLQEAIEALTVAQSISGVYLDVREVCCIIHDPDLRPEDLDNDLQPAAHQLYRIATGEEFSASDLCQGRPLPVGYDMYRLRKDLGHAKFVVLRPDRFVYAACTTLDQLESACGRIEKILLPAVE